MERALFKDNCGMFYCLHELIRSNFFALSPSFTISWSLSDFLAHVMQFGNGAFDLLLLHLATANSWVLFVSKVERSCEHSLQLEHIRFLTHSDLLWKANFRMGCERVGDEAT
jgi:hypothetical protein